MPCAGLTAVLVDPDPSARAEIAAALRSLGMHVVGAPAPLDAIALLEGIDADLIVARTSARDAALALLRSRAPLVEIAPRARIDDVVRAVLDACRQLADAALN